VLGSPWKAGYHIAYLAANLRSQIVISSFEVLNPIFGNAIQTPKIQKSKIAERTPPLQWANGGQQALSIDGVGESCRLSFQAESSGAGHGAWEISPAI
jgi:hypothetical protein